MKRMAYEDYPDVLNAEQLARGRVPADEPRGLSYALYRQTEIGAQGQGSCMDRPPDRELTYS